MSVVKDLAYRAVCSSTKFVYDQGVALLRRMSLTAIVVGLVLLCLFLFFRKKSLVTVSKDLLDDLSFQINKSLSTRKVLDRPREKRRKANDDSISISSDDESSVDEEEDDEDDEEEEEEEEEGEENDDNAEETDPSVQSKTTESDGELDRERTGRMTSKSFALVFDSVAEVDELPVRAPGGRRSSSMNSSEERSESIIFEHKSTTTSPPQQKKRRQPRSVPSAFPVDVEKLAPYDSRRLAQVRGNIKSKPSTSDAPIYVAVTNRKTSPGEEIVRQALEEIFERPFPTKRPAFLKNPETGFNLELDCFNEELGIAAEYQGSQHYEFPNNYHANYKQFTDQVYRDDVKKKLCEEAGVYLIRVPYNVPFNQIKNYIKERLPDSLLANSPINSAT